MVYVLYLVMMVSGVEVSKQESVVFDTPEKCNEYSYKMEQTFAKRLSKGYEIELKCVKERIA
jgi:hypothetical protein